MPTDVSFASALAFAQTLVRIPSQSGGEGNVARRLVAEMKSLSFDDVWTDAVGNVIGRIRGTGRGSTLMLAGHMDVVAAGEPDQWVHPPYGGVVADGMLHGRGSVDVKGPLALLLYAAAGFVRDRPVGDLLVVATVFEEEGGAGMAFLMNERAVVPDGVLLAEATGGDLCVGHRGRAEVVLEVRGTSVHASIREKGDNPLARLPDALALINEYDRRLPSYPGLGRATITPTAVSTPAQNRNVLPERVEVVADCRTVPGTTAARIAADLRGALEGRLSEHVDVRPNTTVQRAYTGLEREFTICSPAFLLPLTHPFVEQARAGIARATGRAPSVRSWRFSTDGGHSCGVHGIPTVGYAPGDEALAHTNRERLDVAEAARAFAVYPHLIRALQATPTEQADRAPAGRAARPTRDA